MARIAVHNPSRFCAHTHLKPKLCSVAGIFLLSMKKIIIVACSFGILIFGVLFSAPSKTHLPEVVETHTQEMISEVAVPIEIVSKLPVVAEVPAPLATSTEKLTAPVEAPRADAVLVVDGKEYPITLKGEETLEDIMKRLRETSDFSYTGKDFSGMGFFVESINGQKSEGRMHWIVYVNDKLASSGVSQLFVKVGDRVEWRYEAEK